MAPGSSAGNSDNPQVSYPDDSPAHNVPQARPGGCPGVALMPGCIESRRVRIGCPGELPGRLIPTTGSPILSVQDTSAYTCRVGCPGELPGYPILTTRREISISAASWSPSKVSLAITTLDSQRGYPDPPT